MAPSPRALFGLIRIGQYHIAWHIFLSGGNPSFLGCNYGLRSWRPGVVNGGQSSDSVESLSQSGNHLKSWHCRTEALIMWCSGGRSRAHHSTDPGFERREVRRSMNNTQSQNQQFLLLQALQVSHGKKPSLHHGGPGEESSHRLGTAFTRPIPRRHQP